MRLVRWSHSCVRLERDGAVLVVDPGIWSEPEALVGADAVLLTHEHHDHADVERLRELTCPIYAPRGADLPDLEIRPGDPGERFAVVGFDVEAVGGHHAAVLPGSPTCANVGYVVDDVYHPGDALALPPRAVDTVLVPMQASWLKTAEGIQFLRAVDAPRAVGIHDGQINARAVRAISSWYDEATAGRYRYVEPGTTVPESRP